MIEDGRAQTLFLFKLSCALVVGGEGTPFQKFAEEEVYFFSTNVCSLQSDYFASHICIQENFVSLK